jgi:hypothetical protein
MIGSQNAIGKFGNHQLVVICSRKCTESGIQHIENWDDHIISTRFKQEGSE